MHSLPELPASFISRRHALWAFAASALTCCESALAAEGAHPDLRWSEAADAMRRRALSWGDQDYGAVLVLAGAVVGEGPSRVVKDGNPSAHAERVALRDAQRRLGRSDLGGTVLYSTSRPCALCEQAAAEAGVARMYFGPRATDAGAPVASRR